MKKWFHKGLGHVPRSNDLLLRHLPNHLSHVKRGISWRVVILHITAFYRDLQRIDHVTLECVVLE